jgi:hypothetical protein
LTTRTPGDVLVYTGNDGCRRNLVDHHADQTLDSGNRALHSYLRNALLAGWQAALDKRALLGFAGSTT